MFRGTYEMSEFCVGQSARSTAHLKTGFAHDKLVANPFRWTKPKQPRGCDNVPHSTALPDWLQSPGMSMRIRIILLIALCAVSPLAMAQSDGSVQGTIVAEADRSAIPDVRVVLAGDTLRQPAEARSDSDGNFAFSRLLPGDYRLTATRANFKTEEYRLTLRPREARNLTIQLAVQPLAQSVDVVAEVEPLASTHSPGATLLSRDWIERIPLPQRTNLPEAIVAASPGMIRGHDDFVHVRGHEVALNPFINGVSFWENPHTVFSPGLGVDYIQSMNLMTGGFSAEYGNRFGGVLDVVTKSGFAMNNNGTLVLGVGSALRHNVGIEAGGHSERAAYYVNLGAFESARFLSPPEERSIHNTGRGTRAFAQFDFVLNSANSAKLILMGDGANFELPKTERDELLRPNFNNSQRTRSQSAILSWDHVLSPTTLVQSALYQKWSKVRMLPNADVYGAQVDSDRTLDTFGIKTDVTRFLGRHTMKAGLDLVLLRPDEDLYYLSQPWITFTHLPEVDENHIHFRGPNLGPGIPRPVVFNERKTGGQGSIYVQDKIRVTRNLTADVGLRFDRYSLAISDTHFSPRVNLAYEFDFGTVLHGSYNHFFVPPPVENILASSAGLTSLISEIGRPLPPVRAIKEDQFELGVVQPIGRAIKVGVTGYYRLSDDPPHTVLFPDSRFYTYASFDKGKAYGMEVKAEAPVIADLGLSGYFNYALGRVWFRNPVTAGFVTEAEHINESGRFLAPMDQTHTMTSGFTYRHQRSGLWTSMAFEYGSGTPGGHGAGAHDHGDGTSHEHAAAAGACGERCPSHFTENLSVGWDVIRRGERSHVGLQFNVENLTNNVYLVSKESTFVQGQYSIPRMYSGSLRFRF
jgi:outer membrane receptor protein involved in Fe transport